MIKLLTRKLRTASNFFRSFNSMAQAKRYFINNLPDYPGGEAIPKSQIEKWCWDVINCIASRQGKSPSDCDGGLYVGIAGVAYMNYYISTLPHFADRKNELLKSAESYLYPSLSYAEKSSRRDKVGFLLGASGVYAVAALIMAELGREKECLQLLEKYASLVDVCLPINFFGHGSDELLVGRAGYMCGILLLNSKFKREIVTKEKTYELWNVMIQSGKEYARRHRSQSPLMYAYYDTEYLGAAHGLSGILQMLLSFPEFLSRNPEAEQTIKGAVDFMLNLQTANGNFPCAMDEVTHPRPEREELVHWCHGAPGVIYLMAKAFLIWKEDKYLKSCLRCGELVWRKGLLRKGPGICHGVAGSGYVFLLLYRLTGEPIHLQRAIQFASFMFTDEFKSARTPDSPYSLYEGFAGTACYLADLLQPEKAEFPFFNVF
ncbi:lanC-like protein 3 [Centruroides sculpturatus]|uniref:lanC-like protein 3 n=1 Tax=Centruroides sculpturatus TaxID=218467 RepID=UPI000C6CB29B|nr:lanC-like protein 3 [Centruroides sculpturatus]